MSEQSSSPKEILSRFVNLLEARRILVNKEISGAFTTEEDALNGDDIKVLNEGLKRAIHDEVASLKRISR